MIFSNSVQVSLADTREILPAKAGGLKRDWESSKSGCEKNKWDGEEKGQRKQNCVCVCEGERKILKEKE